MKIIYLLLFVSISQICMSQVDVELNLKRSTDEEQRVEIYLLNNSSEDIKLAGQNYRLYYDSESSIFDDKSITSNLSEAYSKIKVVEHFFDIDASGFGPLSFDSHLGFINFHIDFNEIEKDAILIESNGKLKITEFSFLGDELPNIVWGQKNITKSYATAFVELAQISNTTKQTEKLNVDKYKSIYKSENEFVDESFSAKYYPNPFSESLSIEFNRPLTSSSKLFVKDIFGKTHQSLTLDKNSETFQLDGRSLIPGSYLITIVDDTGKENTLKAIKF